LKKHLTTKSISLKTPLQLFNEVFINNQRLNSKNKNRIELIDNDENLFVVRVIAMEQQFWSVSYSKNVAQNEACQEAIETLCHISFREAKAEFIRALQAINKIQIPAIINPDNNNNDQQQEQKQSNVTTESIHVHGTSSSFLLPNDENELA